MADWFKCAPLPLLDALQDLSEDAQLVYVKALLVIYHRDGRIAATALRSRFPNWRPKRLERALTELIDAGKLIGTVSGQLHNPRAMHELASLADGSLTRALSGSKGGKTRANRERLARQIVERNLSPDLFGTAANPTETPLNDGSTDVEQALKDGSVDIEKEYHARNPNVFNGTGQAPLNHARASDKDTDEDKEIPPVSPDEDEDVFAIPPTRKRKPSVPLPDGWSPPVLDELTPMVRARVDAWPDGEFDREREKFMTDAVAADRRHKDWGMAFGKWLLVHDGYLSRPRGNYSKPAGAVVPELGSGRPPPEGMVWDDVIGAYLPDTTDQLKIGGPPDA